MLGSDREDSSREKKVRDACSACIKSLGRRRREVPTDFEEELALSSPSFRYPCESQHMRNKAPKSTAPSSSSGNSREDLSPFKEVDAVLKCALPPSQIEFPLDSVKHQLHEMLFRYNYDLQGIPVSYSHIVFDRGKYCGRIMGEMPSVHIDIKTKLMVFQPELGQKLFGKIMKVSYHFFFVILR